MGNGSLRRLPLLPLSKRRVTDNSRPRTPRGAQLQPNHPQRIPSMNGCHKRSPRQSRGVLPRFLGRTSSQTRRGNVADVSHDPNPQAVKAMPPRSSVSVSRTSHRQLQQHAEKIGRARAAFPAGGLQLHPASTPSGSRFSRLHLQLQHFDRDNQDKEKLMKPSQQAAKPPRARGLVSGISYPDTPKTVTRQPPPSS